MKILEVKDLALEGVKVYKFGQFPDERGYFTEPFRRSDLGLDVVQMNESFSRPNVLRGLHFQWNPYMGKLVRTLWGHMVDIVLDVRRGSLTFGKAITYDMPVTKECGEWIWVPPGFAHGNYFREHTRIEYLCTGEHSPGCEYGISVFDPDIDWSLAGGKPFFLDAVPVMSEKDKLGHTLSAWQSDENAWRFNWGLEEMAKHGRL